MKKQPFTEEKQLKGKQREIMEISSTGYGYEIHPADETTKMIKQRNK